MSIGIKSALAMTYRIFMEKPYMSTYCRTKADPYLYYEAKPMIKDAEFPEIYWKLRRVMRESDILITADDFHENYVTCSAFEAIHSHQA